MYAVNYYGMHVFKWACKAGFVYVECTFAKSNELELEMYAYYDANLATFFRRAYYMLGVSVFLN